MRQKEWQITLKQERIKFNLDYVLFLPPAYVVRREGNVFTDVSLSVHTLGGTPVPGSFPGLWSQVLFGWVPQSCPSWGGTPVLAGVVPLSWPGRIPQSQQGPKTGVPPRQDMTGVPPAGTGLWYPPVRTGVPPTRTGLPLTRTWVPIPPRQNSRASTCYATGGMRLAVTQEDFLLIMHIHHRGCVFEV